jgi:tRNA dimethylallyltransferase
LTGPTGAGKSALAIALARALGGEIVNADSLAFYRGLDIGSAKPTLSERAAAPHHLLDVVDPDEDFTAADFARLARPLIAEISARGRLPLVVGGTGLYLRTLVRGLFDGPPRDPGFRSRLHQMLESGRSLHHLLSELDPLAAARIKPTERHRLERALEVFHLTGESIVTHQARHALADKHFDALTVIVDLEKRELDERLRIRTQAMFEGGLVEEARGLLEKGYSPSLKPFQAVGYREAVDAALGKIGLGEAMASTLRRTRQLAKRQRTWFRGQMPEGLWMIPDLAAVGRVVEDFWKS